MSLFISLASTLALIIEARYYRPLHPGNAYVHSSQAVCPLYRDWDGYAKYALGNVITLAHYVPII